MIKIILKTGFYYKGEFLKEDKLTITILDFNNKEVTVSKDQIAIREVSNG